MTIPGSGDELQTTQAYFDLWSMPFKVGGLSLANPAMMANHHYETSRKQSKYLLDHLTGKANGDFLNHLNRDHIEAERKASRGRYYLDCEDKVAKFKTEFPDLPWEIIDRAKETSLLLQVYPSAHTRTIFPPQMFTDIITLRYGLPPIDLPSKCDGCRAKFDRNHALNCIKGGRVHQRHTLVAETLASLMCQAHHTCQVAFEPRVQFGVDHSTKFRRTDPPSSIARGPRATIPPTAPATQAETPAASTQDDSPPAPILVPANRLRLQHPSNDKDKDLRGDLIVEGFTDPGRATIFDVSIFNPDADSYKGMELKKVLDNRANAKIRKYQDLCEQNQRLFTPLIATCDGVLHSDFENALRFLAAKIAARWRRPKSEVCKYVFTTIRAAIAYGTHNCLRGSRVPLSKISNPVPSWKDGSGLSLYGYYFD